MRLVCLLIFTVSSADLALGQTSEEIWAANEVLIENKLKLDVSMNLTDSG